MWYSVIKVEHKTFTGKKLMVGTIFSVAKHADGMVACTDLHNIANGTYYFTQEQCRKMFTQPTTDIDSAHEEAIMLCEAAYC
jgi:hypothetical protein